MDEISSVLIVDDDEVVLRMLGNFFQTEVPCCETASNAASALDLIRENSFDIMIADISMPKMNGLELTVQVKQIRPDMPVILMTGFLEDFSYDGAIEAGAADFIKKPFSFEEVKARIKQAFMHKKMREMSMKDELTGLYNRRGLITLGQHILKIEKRDNRESFLLYADMDGLKSINDTLGHNAGDAALIETAGIFKAIYRESDVIARIGGDEFAVIPVRGHRSAAERIAARLQDEIEVHNAREGRNYKLSVSTGLAYFDTAASISIEDLLAEADKAMYENKKKKRAS